MYILLVFVSFSVIPKISFGFPLLFRSLLKDEMRITRFSDFEREEKIL